MTNNEYAECQSILITQSRLITVLPLMDFCNAIEHSQAVGPLIDPTLYMRAGKELGRMKAIADAALVFQSELIRLREQWAREDGRMNIGKEASNAGAGS